MDLEVSSNFNEVKVLRLASRSEIHWNLLPVVILATYMLSVGTIHLIFLPFKDNNFILLLNYLVFAAIPPVVTVWISSRFVPKHRFIVACIVAMSGFFMQEPPLKLSTVMGENMGWYDFARWCLGILSGAGGIVLVKRSLNLKAIYWKFISNRKNPIEFSKVDTKRKRSEAFVKFMKAYSLFDSMEYQRSLKELSASLQLDPEFPYANIILGEFAMKAEDWNTAKNLFEKGLMLLPLETRDIDLSELGENDKRRFEANTRCFLGYVYVKLAQSANLKGDQKGEMELLNTARGYFKEGLNMNPDAEARKLAEMMTSCFKF